MAADPKVKETLLRLADIYERKNSCYSAGDPWATLEASREFGVHPVINMLCRVNEKMKRIQSLLKPVESIDVSESVQDSMLDMAVYLVLASVYLDKDKTARVSTPKL